MTNPNSPPPAENAPVAETLPPKRSTRTRNVLTVILVVLAIFSLAYQRFGGIGLFAKTDHIAWQGDFGKAMAESKATGKPVLLDFWGSWCVGCDHMKHHSWPDEKVQQLVKDKYVALFLDVDDPAVAKVAQKYAGETLPRVLILDSDGNVLRSGEYMDATELATFLSGGTPATKPATMPALQASAR
jgi:thiol:disulfide interchange protein